MPPTIPTLLNAHDCGIFLLMFIKFDIKHWNFEFKSEDTIKLRDLIKSEILSQQLNVTKVEYVQLFIQSQEEESVEQLMQRWKIYQIRTKEQKKDFIEHS